METQIKITNDASVCTIDIEGIIGVPEGEQFANTSRSIATYERMHEEIDKIKDIEANEIVVNIRSTGGDVNDALLIHDSLGALGAKITTRCYGYTASAATIIAQAASDGCREISASALYLVHQSSSCVEGNVADLAERIDLLQKTDDRIASLYAARSGGDKSNFEELMRENNGRGRWLSPEEVVEAGLADTIIGLEELSKPKGLINRVKEWLSPNNKGEDCPTPSSDLNILHLPKEALPSTSVIALEEGQNRFKRSKISQREDPSLEGAQPTHNALAYAEDLRNLQSRLR